MFIFLLKFISILLKKNNNNNNNNSKVLNVAAVPTKILILIWKIFIFDLGSAMPKITLAIKKIEVISSRSEDAYSAL
uniref:Uncharacterized protein n=1 Tax=Trichogramma kaykai TaxID=54128 RepID=A0ABD2XNS2_9HYME